MAAGSNRLFVGELSKSYQGPILAPDYAKDLFNDFGCVVRARMETGEDLHLWTFLYRQIGSELIIDNDVCQTLMIEGRFDDKQRMSDTKYVNKGQNIDDYHALGTMQYEGDKSQATWKLGGRVLRTTEGGWKIEGEHAGVEVDLKLTQYGKAFFPYGRFENLSPEHEGVAGYIVHATVTGTVKTPEGKIMRVTEGYAVNERIIMAGQVAERINYMGGRGLTWLHSWGKSLSFWIMSGEKGPLVTFMLNVDGETLVTNKTRDAWTEEIGTWQDPRTNQINPCRWHTWANVPGKGRLDAEITAFGRGIYTWTRAGGVVLVHQFIADSTVKFTRLDGTVVEEKQMASVEYMRTLYNQTAL